MAERGALYETLPNGVALVTWTGLLNGDNGSAVEVPWMADKCVHVYGTMGAAGSVSIKGTNKSPIVVGTDPILTNPQGNVITFTVAGMRQVLENPRYFYPHVTAGDGTTNLTVSVACKPSYKG
jgi:hypothetical protein